MFNDLAKTSFGKSTLPETHKFLIHRLHTRGGGTVEQIPCTLKSSRKVNYNLILYLIEIYVYINSSLHIHKKSVLNNVFILNKSALVPSISRMFLSIQPGYSFFSLKFLWVLPHVSFDLLSHVFFFLSVLASQILLSATVLLSILHLSLIHI